MRYEKRRWKGETRGNERGKVKETSKGDVKQR